MLKGKTIVLAILIIFITHTLKANEFNGAWHLRVLDGMEVRKARAILNFDMDKMTLFGFDACNQIGGTLIKNSDVNITIPILISTKMACRKNIHHWVRKCLHDTLKEGFSIKEEKKYGVQGMTLKSRSHELFLKKMER